MISACAKNIFHASPESELRRWPALLSATKNPTPLAQRLVRGEEHRLLVQIAMVDHLKEHIGGVSAVRQISYLVDYENVGLHIGRQRVTQSAFASRSR